ncbi:hypothetical protein TNCV_4646031 [Trichonephila clavipes]|nr:hypothetical protein TNCV_4646031 [Trichonephila clavipes]
MSFQKLRNESCQNLTQVELLHDRWRYHLSSSPQFRHGTGGEVYQVVSASNLDKLERVQLSAVRVITGLRNNCPSDIVLYGIVL